MVPVSVRVGGDHQTTLSNANALIYFKIKIFKFHFFKSCFFRQTHTNLFIILNVYLVLSRCV